VSFVDPIINLKERLMRDGGKDVTRIFHLKWLKYE
jgi:hypothetical protein